MRYGQRKGVGYQAMGVQLLSFGWGFLFILDLGVLNVWVGGGGGVEKV